MVFTMNTCDGFGYYRDKIFCLVIIILTLTSNSHTTVMVIVPLFILVEPSDTWQLYRPELTISRGEKEYVDDV